MVNNKDDALKYIDMDLYELLYLSNKIREKNFGKSVKFCSIVNAKSGRCSEDCKFCGQSGHNSAKAEEFDLIEPDKMLSAAIDAENNGAVRFGIVTSGRGIIDNKEWDKIYESIRLLKKKTALFIDASLGCLGKKHADLLKAEGLDRYHHNLETSPGYFSKICTTHKYEDRLNTVLAVKEAGLGLCCGGLFGLGEKWMDRIEFAFILKELDPDSIPINFLNPVSGTPLEKKKFLSPSDCLRIIAIYRLILPDKNISVCGGREVNLRDLQSLMYYAGANGSMLGNYLTTTGRKPEEDTEMIKKLGLSLWKKKEL